MRAFSSFLAALFLVACAPPAVAAPGPDLDASGVYVGEDFPLVGSSVSLEMYVYTWEIPAGSIVPIAVAIDGVLIGNVDMLVDDWFIRVDLPDWTATTPGAHVVRASIDPGNAIAEVDETNNVATEEFVVYAGYADLAVDIAVEELPVVVDGAPELPNPIDVFHITTTMCNVGSFPAGRTYHSVHIESASGLEPAPGGSDRIAEWWGALLGPGDCITQELQYRPTRYVGDFRFTVDVDADPEQRTSNNHAESWHHVVVGGLGGTRTPA
jgi:hypothetical protein